MTHRDKDFWKYVCAYVLLGSSLFLIVSAIVEWTFFGEKLQLAGAAGGLFLGTMFLSSLKRKRSAEEDTNSKR